MKEEDPHTAPVIGIDVGGPRKGFHAVLLHGENELTLLNGFRRTVYNVAAVVDWCLQQNPIAIAIDAPCGWGAKAGQSYDSAPTARQISSTGKSRQAERELRIGGQIVQCYKTPTEKRAKKRKFYGWVREGHALYQALGAHFRLYDGESRTPPVMFETFPHAVACALSGKRISAANKEFDRPEILRNHGLPKDATTLPNIDYVDAALCAWTARQFLLGNTQQFGNKEEGYIVIPRTNGEQQSGHHCHLQLPKRRGTLAGARRPRKPPLRKPEARRQDGGAFGCGAPPFVAGFRVAP